MRLGSSEGTVWDFLTPENRRFVSQIALRIARRYPNSLTEAEDIAQDVILRILQIDKRERLTFVSTEAFRHWLSAVARKVTLEHFHKAKARGSPRQVTTLSGFQVDPHLQAIETVDEIITRLDPADRVLIQAREAGDNWKQIAKSLRISATTLRKRYSRAIARLRAKLRTEGMG
jgi:RNA polymerase sigma factor (sigma-70 family)